MPLEITVSGFVTEGNTVRIPHNGPYPLSVVKSPKPAKFESLDTFKAGGRTGHFPHHGLLSCPLCITFVSLGFQNGRGERDVFSNTARSPLRFPLP